MIRKFGGSSGIEIQPQGIDLGIGGSNIKSIQRGETTMTAVTMDIPIASINKNNTITVLTGIKFQLGSTDSRKTTAFLELTSATNLRISQAGTYYAPNIVVVTWEVIEFNNVKSKQVGDIALSSTDVNVSINSVDLNKSHIECSAVTTQIDSYAEAKTNAYTNNLTSSTNINFKRNSSATGLTVKWQVIEFD